jgi:hypothetical protein
MEERKHARLNQLKWMDLKSLDVWAGASWQIVAMRSSRSRSVCLVWWCGRRDFWVETIVNARESYHEGFLRMKHVSKGLDQKGSESIASLRFLSPPALLTSGHFCHWVGKDWIKQEAPQVSAELLATVQGNPQPTPSIHTTFQSKNFQIMGTFISGP